MNSESDAKHHRTLWEEIRTQYNSETSETSDSPSTLSPSNQPPDSQALSSGREVALPIRSKPPGIGPPAAIHISSDGSSPTATHLSNSSHHSTASRQPSRMQTSSGSLIQNFPRQNAARRTPANSYRKATQGGSGSIWTRQRWSRPREGESAMLLSLGFTNFTDKRARQKDYEINMG